MDEAVLNVAFALYVGASWLRSELWLRVVLMVSSVFSMIAGLLIGSPSMVGWNIAFVAVMGVRVAKLLAERRSIELSEEEAWIRAEVFPGLAPVDFVRVWEAGEERVFEEAPLVSEGELADELMLVMSGAPAVSRDGALIATLGPGQFAGEMAFATSAPSNATVTPAGQPARCRVWSTTRLRGLFRTSPELGAGFEQAISVDLVAKVAGAD